MLTAPAMPAATAGAVLTPLPVKKSYRSAYLRPATGDSGAGGKQEMLGMQYANHMTPTVDIGGETGA